MTTFINSFVKGCGICQQSKSNTHLTIPNLNPISSKTTLPFKQVSTDLITDLLISKGFDSILVVVNHGLMKGVKLCPCNKTIMAEGVAQLFFNNVYCQYGLYDKIISNRGPQFASAFAKELSHLLGYELRLLTAYHPQTDGETKQVNQEVETYL